MISKKWLMDMMSLGYIVINNTLNTSQYRTTLIITNKEVFELKLIDHEIMQFIINDIIEACREDLESKQQNKNIEKIIKEIVRCFVIERI